MYIISECGRGPRNTSWRQHAARRPRVGGTGYVWHLKIRK